MKDDINKSKKDISNVIYNTTAIMGLIIILLNLSFAIMSYESFFNKSTLSGFLIISVSILLKYYQVELR